MLATLAIMTGVEHKAHTAGRLRWCALAVLAGAQWIAAASGQTTQAPAAQAPSAQTGGTSTAAPQHTAAPTHRRARQKPAAATPSPVPAAVTPPVAAAPPPPNWPANDKPADAAVMWDSKGLSIVAANSSLQQILEQVATETGAKVDGMNGDQRVFGKYGPGPAREVIAQLLDGSGYNVLMIGDQGGGAPRQIVLSSRPSGPAPVYNGNNQAEEEVEAEPPPPPPPPEPQPMPAQNPVAPNRGMIQPQMQGPFGTRPFPGQAAGQDPNQQQPNGNQQQ